VDVEVDAAQGGDLVGAGAVGLDDAAGGQDLLRRWLAGVGARTDRDHTLTLAGAGDIGGPARIVLAGRVSDGSSFRLSRRHLGVRRLADMLIDAVRSLWAEPRVPAPPPWTWRDRMLVLALATGALLEALLRDDLVWRTSAVVIGVGLLLLAPWRRTRPLLVVAVVFGSIGTYDMVAVLAGVDPELTMLWIQAWILLLPYALLRWGSGRQIVIGVAILLIFLAIDPGRTGWGDLLLGLVFFAFSATLGTAARYRATSRVRELDQVRLREREQLARELHDTVAHHVSAIAIQAQAGRAVAATSPEGPPDALAVIETAASRTLREMRAMVGMLRDGEDAEWLPSRGSPTSHAWPATPASGPDGRAAHRRPRRGEPNGRGGDLPPGAGVGHERDAPRPQRHQDRRAGVRRR
jgi:hypothetical protein